VILGLAVLVEHLLVTDRRTDRQTHDDGEHRGECTSMELANAGGGGRCVFECGGRPTFLLVVFDVVRVDLDVNHLARVDLQQQLLLLFLHAVDVFDLA